MRNLGRDLLILLTIFAAGVAIMAAVRWLTPTPSYAPPRPPAPPGVYLPPPVRYTPTPEFTR